MGIYTDRTTEISIELVQKWIQQWGVLISEAVLETGCDFYTDPEIPGCVGYKIESRYAIVYGEPICPKEYVHPLCKSFHRFCQEKKLGIIFMIVSDDFAKWANHYFHGGSILIGEELIFNPVLISKEWNGRLKNTVNHAIKSGLRVNEYISSDPSIENAIKGVHEKWTKSRRGPQIYLGKMNFFDNCYGKRWFYIQDDKEVIGAALISRLDASDGWLLKHSITLPKAPRGTSEFLITTILQTLAKENCQYMTYGVIPIHEIKVEGFQPYVKGLMSFGYRMFKWIFRLGQRKMFWQKFHPKTANSYLVFSCSKFGFEELNAIIKALNTKY